VGVGYPAFCCSFLAGHLGMISSALQHLDKAVFEIGSMEQEKICVQRQ